MYGRFERQLELKIGRLGKHRAARACFMHAPSSFTAHIVVKKGDPADRQGRSDVGYCDELRRPVDSRPLSPDSGRNEFVVRSRRI